MKKVVGRGGIAFALVWLSGCGPVGSVDLGAAPDAGAVAEDASASELGPPAFETLPDLGWPALDDLGPGSAVLRFVIDDADTGQPTPSRVIFRPPIAMGFPGSAGAGDNGFAASPGVVGAHEGLLLAYGEGCVLVPPGKYDLFVTRGPEYEAEELTVTVAAGETKDVHATLERTVDTRGWLAADLHVHTSRSFDSRTLPELRVVSMVTNGVEVVVATDHNVATDLGPVAAALGYGPDLIGTVVGDEFNFAEGHGGAYPVPYDASQPGGGAPPYQNVVNGGCADPAYGINCLTAADAFPIMHAQLPGTTVVTVNHPWWGNGDLGYFTNIEWGAGTSHPLPATLDTAQLFDALELINGFQAFDTPEDNLLADWFYLLGQGHRVTALGNSDTHGMSAVRPGWPRTWLQLPNDQPGATTGQLLADALRGNRAIASTGPFLTMTVDDAPIGAQVKPRIRGEVTVELEADAPDWIHVDELRVYVNGEPWSTIPIPPGRRPAFSGSIVLPVKRDSFVVAQVSGKEAMPADVVGDAGAQHGNPMLPWAVTNPIYVDADRDGVWTPPRNVPKQKNHERARPMPPSTDGCVVGDEPALETPQHVLMPLLF